MAAQATAVQHPTATRSRAVRHAVAPAKPSRGAQLTARARKAAGVAVAAARRGAANALGVCGLASIAVGAGAEWGWPVGLMVGGPLAVWVASLLPGGES